MSRLNLNGLFQGKNFKPGFLKNIDIDSRERSNLMAARKDIRAHIRSKFDRLGELYDQRTIFSEAYFRANRNNLNFQKPYDFKPKFLTQGSFLYKTINWPAHLPPQQVDLDDGVYVPMPFYNRKPILRTSTYFAVVEKALESLCEDKGWTLIKDKNSCIRVILNSKKSHIDLPLYGVPQEDFDQVTVEFAAHSLNFGENSHFSDALRNNNKLKIESSKIKLATREDDWISSDPQSLNDWFNGAVSDHGKQLRRVSRFLKAWRDFEWQESKLSSIILMTVAVEAYDNSFNQNARPLGDRDDLALLETVRFLVKKLDYDIINPALPDDVKNLSSGWNMQQRMEYKTAAQDLASKLERAINGGFNPEVAIRHLKQVFGERIPNDTSLIEYGDDPKKEVLSTVAATQPAPKIMEHKSA